MYTSLFKFQRFDEPVDLHLLTGIIFNHKAVSEDRNPAVLRLKHDFRIGIQYDAAVILDDYTVTAEEGNQDFPTILERKHTFMWQ